MFCRIIIRRFVGIIFIILISQFLTIWMTSMLPGSYCSFALPDHASLETRQACLQKEPSLWQKYWTTLPRLFRLELGQSLQGSHRPVSVELAEQIPATFWLASISYILSLSAGIIGGIVAAKERRKLWGRIVNGGGIVLLTLPIVILAFLLRYLLVFSLKWLPVLDDASTWQSLVMPVMAISLPLSAWFMRLTRNALVVELEQDYIRTARAKGIKERSVFMRHALRNTLNALIPVAGLVLIGLLDGALVTEIIFNRPGLGRYTVNAVVNRDYPAIQGVVLLVTVMTVTINLVADIVHAYLFPQSRNAMLHH